jgi:ABC-type antimicrobial peptide transport system permease subunit
MPILYAIKHLFRSWKLFIALLIGIILAATFFAGIDIKANDTVKQAIDQQLSSVYVDMTADVSSLSAEGMIGKETAILSVQGVTRSEVISAAWQPVLLPSQTYANYSEIVRIVGIMNDSSVYDGWLNRPSEELGENETYVSSTAFFTDNVNIGDKLSIVFNVYSSSTGQSVLVPLDLTVRGFAELNSRSTSIVMGVYNSYYTYVFPENRGSFLILNWQKTMRRIIDRIYDVNSNSYSMISTALISVDRDSLIAPWDIGTSITNLNQLSNRIGYVSGVSVQNNLQNTLQNFQFQSMTIRLAFTVVSLPIFFVAWYMGTTVSDVSFNLRRREIGLLLTKGFSRGQILSIFITETLLLGLIGGLIGVFVGFLLIPLFTQFSTANLFNTNLISPYTLVLTAVFGVTIALFSTYSSARRASRLATVDALREYLPIEEEKAYRKRLPWLAFILGTYKIVVFALGVNMSTLLMNVVFSSGNFIIGLLVVIFVALDAVLNFIGPLLFFWGFTKLFIQSSLKFQELATRAARFLGDLGALATKNVRRNPTRSAKIAFLIALIIGYSVQVTGQLASNSDYNIRSIYSQVGGDIAISVSNVSKAPTILNEVLTNLSASIKDSTTEYSFYGSSNRMIGLTAVDPNSWRRTAYYEDSWFSSTDLNSAFNNLDSNGSIILDLSFAKDFGPKIGENITIAVGNAVKEAKIVGFFGVKSSDGLSVLYPNAFSQYPSFVSLGFYQEISQEASASAKVLLKLESGVNGTNVAINIRALEGNAVANVDSFAERWKSSQGDVVSMSGLDVQRLGVVFAFLAASVGIALISTVSMRERSREATIMSVRGLSYKQLTLMFLTENLALVSFSVVLGLVVGVIVTNGSIASTNSFAFSIPQHRLVLPLDMGILLFSCITLVFVATILPILIMSRDYVTKLERMVRLR